MGGTAFVCINRLCPGHVHHISDGLIAIGEIMGLPGRRIEQVAEWFRSSQVPVKMLENLLYGRWEKLVWNIPFNGLSALLDLTTDRLIATPAGESLVRKIMSEVIAAAKGAGVELPQMLIGAKIEATRKMGDYRTSMHLDMRAGRALEIEAIISHPIAIAQIHKTPVLTLEILRNMLVLRDRSRQIA